jgi:5-methylcytosine-specific restriction endonuclease McrA
MAAVRYLEADKVTLPARAPLFVEPGHCQWCNKELTGKARFYCRPTKVEKWDYGASQCAIDFLNWWCSRPAYVRATFIRDSFTCQECGLHPMREDKPWLPDISQLECDHIIPLARGGETTMGNLQTLCKKCNRKKGIKVADEVEEDYPRVIPSRDKTRCPDCGAPGYRVLPWTPPVYFDPMMIKVECLNCGEDSYIAPAPWGRRRGKEE